VGGAPNSGLRVRGGWPLLAATPPLVLAVAAAVNGLLKGPAAFAGFVSHFHLFAVMVSTGFSVPALAVCAKAWVSQYATGSPDPRPDTAHALDNVFQTGGC